MSLQKIIAMYKKTNPEFFTLDQEYSVTSDSKDIHNKIAVAEVASGQTKKIFYDMALLENSSCDYTLMLDVHGTVELCFKVNLKQKSALSCSILYTISGKGSLIIKADIVHEEPESKSRFIAKGIVSDNGSCNVEVKTRINQEAIHSDALQTIKHMVSDNAVVVAVPVIEALSDQVVCKHGSSIGSFDPQALLFLQLKGYDIERAKQLLLDVFLNIISNKNLYNEF